MSAPQKDLPKGITCECGHFMPFGAWVYAHWHEDLVATCEACGRKYSLRRGIARPKSARNSLGSGGGE